MTTLCRRLTIHGRVQGVGFRWSLCAEAKALGLTGWVRNRHNGSVEALVCGTIEAIDALTLWANQGPSTARVDRIISNDEPCADSDETLAGFRQRPTF